MTRGPAIRLCRESWLEKYEAGYGGKSEPPEGYALPTWNAARGRDAENRGLEKSIPNTLRGCLDEAKLKVDQGYDLLNPQMNILPIDISNTIEFLKTAKGDIEHLEELLQETLPLPEQGGIIDQVRIITDQIDEYLIPHLKPSESPDKDFQRRFEPLLKALNKLDRLIPN
jgi:hypothetical protein